MKKFLTLAALVISTAALAYPEFTGNESLTINDCIKCLKANNGKVTVEDMVNKLRELKNLSDEEAQEYTTALTQALASEQAEKTEVAAPALETQEEEQEARN